MSYAEDIQGLNRLWDGHAEKFAGSVHGRFPAESVRNDVLSLRMQGLIGMKTREEIEADCARVDREMSAQKRRTARFENKYGVGGKGCKGYSKPQKRNLLAAVERELDLGYGIKDACRMVGITAKSYHKFRADLGRPKRTFKRGARKGARK